MCVFPPAASGVIHIKPFQGFVETIYTRKYIGDKKLETIFVDNILETIFGDNIWRILLEYFGQIWKKANPLLNY